MNAFLGIFLHAVGGFSSASFYVPINKVRQWAWETYWITLGFVAWIVMPWVGACLTTNDVWAVLSNCPTKNLIWTYLFGVMWGIGGLSCGLSLRFLGLSLGQSLSLGFCAAFGTLIPPIFAGDIDTLFTTASGLVVMAGIMICLAGITICGVAGALKERQLTTEQKKQAIKDFALVKGFAVAIFGGIMSACMAFAFNAGKPIAAAALEAGTASIYQNNPVLIVALAGGFSTNIICCLFLNIKNKSIKDYISPPPATLAMNYILAFLSGAMWYGQFFFYGMGTTKMGKYDFTSWSIHMAFIIVFSNFWGIVLKEWKLVNSRTKGTLFIGILVLIISTFVIGIGNNLAKQPEEPEKIKETLVPTPHFPDRLHTFVWRNWESVSADRMADVLKTDPDNIRQIALAMGLPPQKPINPDFLERGYLSLIKRNWHLVSYDQLLKLLGWNDEQLYTAIQMEDFLWVKLGSMKPTCPPLQYTPPNDAAQERCRQIKTRVNEHFSDALGKLQEPRFQFIKDLSVPDQNRTPRKIIESEDKSIRFIYSYFALYGDPLLNPELDPFPDGLLQRLSQVGVNGVWLHVTLSKMAPSEVFPEFGKDYQTRLKNLDRLVQRAKRYGVKIYLYINEPRGAKEDFFKGRENLKGVHYTWADNDLYAMCTSAPEVRNWMRDSLAHVFREVPDLGGVFTITASENITNCWSSFDSGTCPRCSKRSPADVISEVNQTIAEGVRQGSPDAKVITWDWGWRDEWVEPIIKALPDNVYYMTVSEWDLPITRGGVATKVNEYSLSAVGPSDRSIKRWNWARQRGLKTLAKVQVNATWELSTLPYLPVMSLVAQHAENLAKANIDGQMLSWSLGGCPSPNLQVVEQFSRKPTPSIEQALTTVAINDYGPHAAPDIIKAWSLFSRAFSEYPYCQKFIYRGPMQVGPANLLFPVPTGMEATMVGFPFDDIDDWRDMYPAEVLAGQFDKIASGWQLGLDAFEIALTKEMTGEQENTAYEDYRIALAGGVYFKSTANQIRFILARDELLAEEPNSSRRIELIRTIQHIAQDELDIAKRFFPLARDDSRFGFEASNHYAYLPLDFIEKAINCDYILNHWLDQQKPTDRK